MLNLGRVDVASGWEHMVLTVGKLAGLLLAAIALSIAFVHYAAAQSAPGSFGPSQKDCQTIRTCNFARGAEVRGCLSSYSCRSCRFVPRCQTIAGKRVCDYQAQCGWRGA